jgi:magnesium transporter
MPPGTTGDDDALRKEIDAAADAASLAKVLHLHRSADIADVLVGARQSTAQAVWDALDPVDTGRVLAESAPDIVAAFLRASPVEQIAAVASTMPTDEGADLLGALPHSSAESVLSLIPPERATALRRVMAYPHDSAGGIMTTEFVSVAPEQTVAAALSGAGRQHRRVESIETVFVLDSEGTLQGTVEIGALLEADANVDVRSLVNPGPLSVTPYYDQETCAHVMERYNLRVLPVVDQGRRMLGAITVDDILDVMEDEASEDLLGLAGVGAGEHLQSSFIGGAWRRLPWLAAALVVMSLLGGILSRFESTLTRVVALSFFIPAVMGLSGNAGMQSAAVTLRALATGALMPGRYMRALRREASIALTLASICALGLGAGAYGIFALAATGAPEAVTAARFGLTVGVSLFCGMLVSTLIGTAAPMACHRLGIDPAVAAGPFVTMTVDVGSQAVYLGLASWMLYT